MHLSSGKSARKDESTTSRLESESFGDLQDLGVERQYCFVSIDQSQPAVRTKADFLLRYCIYFYMAYPPLFSCLGSPAASN